MDGKRSRGRPKKTWRATWQEDLNRREIHWKQAKKLAADRVEWRSLLPIARDRRIYVLSRPK